MTSAVAVLTFAFVLLALAVVAGLAIRSGMEAVVTGMPL